MDQTANLALPYIMPAQAQKFVSHNEALARLDAIVQLAVLDRDLATPPASPAEGDRYIGAASASDAWSGWTTPSPPSSRAHGCGSTPAGWLC